MATTFLTSPTLVAYGELFETVGTFPRTYRMGEELHRDGESARYRVTDVITGTVHNLVMHDATCVRVMV